MSEDTAERVVEGRISRNWESVVRTENLMKSIDVDVTKTTVGKSAKAWKTAPWKRYRKIAFGLQKRIWKATREGNTAKARHLQKLLLKSYSAKMLAVRQVTQLNEGRKSAGVDGKANLSYKQRIALVHDLGTANRWQPKELREVAIPKKDGTIRTLKVPTIADRAWQHLCKQAIEPAHEALFHQRSFGFRPGRSAHDAQKVVFLNLRSISNGKDKRVLELDIEKCFDRIAHGAIMQRVIAPQAIKSGIFRCLKKGAAIEFPDQGTPQGGVISPLLANIALDGIENIHTSIRYADDMVFFLKPEDDVDAIRAKIDAFLAERKLKVKDSKTKLVTALEGFDFLGWRFYVQRNNGKFRSKPSTANYAAFRNKIKAIVNNSCWAANEKAKRLAPIVRGWRNYHRYTRLKGEQLSLWPLNHSTFKHFMKDKNMSRQKAEQLVKSAFPVVRIEENGFANVRGKASPYDGNTIYWSQRNSKLYESKTAQALKKQSHKCAKCNLTFIDDETVHLHHVDGKHDNWQSQNLVAVHRSCHQEIHYAA